jgi:hypothetical protein
VFSDRRYSSMSWTVLNTARAILAFPLAAAALNTISTVAHIQSNQIWTQCPIVLVETSSPEIVGSEAHHLDLIFGKLDFDFGGSAIVGLWVNDISDLCIVLSLIYILFTYLLGSGSNAPVEGFCWVNILLGILTRLFGAMLGQVCERAGLLGRGLSGWCL